MESIFHEKQEGSLCAQHCLNALLQGPYFTAVDLASLAQQIDEEERYQMAELGTETDEYRNFLKQQAFICNYRNHWFTIRKLGCQWFNLNSLLSGPQLISNTYLRLYLRQLNLEDCTADPVLVSNPVVPEFRVPLSSSSSDDPEMKEALQLSLQEVDDEQELQIAIQMSLLTDNNQHTVPASRSDPTLLATQQ